MQTRHQVLPRFLGAANVKVVVDAVLAGGGMADAQDASSNALAAIWKPVLRTGSGDSAEIRTDQAFFTLRGLEILLASGSLTDIGDDPRASRSEGPHRQSAQQIGADHEGQNENNET